MTVVKIRADMYHFRNTNYTNYTNYMNSSYCLMPG